MTWSIVAAQRRRLAQETGTRVKDPGGRMAIALLFPNTYHAGMSNLGFQAVYGLLNDWPDVAAERAFFPERDLAAEYVRTGAPLVSIENQRPLAEFELLAFSLSHENDYPQVLSMLEMARLPLRRADRGENSPLVLAGGVAMRGNPEPLADFLDLILIGDGEVIIPPLLRAWRETRSEPLPKEDRVWHLARSVPGAYAPGMYHPEYDRQGRQTALVPTREGLPDRIRAARASQLPEPALTTTVITPETEFARTRLVEIGRGCPYGCRFCLAGFVYRPPRYQSVESILTALGEPVDGERVGLVGPAVADHPRIEELVRALTDQGREVTVSSLRVESLSPGLAAALAQGRLRGAAIAPEAGSSRLRAVINKTTTESEILEGAALLASAGLKRLKCYFMLGLPEESLEDLAAMADLVRKIKAQTVTRARGRLVYPELTLSVAAFVPKPFTPFALRPACASRELASRAKDLKGALKSMDGLRLNFDPPKWAYLQTLLSRSDRRVGPAIEVLARGGSLPDALSSLSFDPDLVVLGPWPTEGHQPWSIVDNGLDDDFLADEDRRAASGRTTPPCNPEKCRRCGICGPEREEI